MSASIRNTARCPSLVAFCANNSKGLGRCHANHLLSGDKETRSRLHVRHRPEPWWRITLVICVNANISNANQDSLWRNREELACLPSDSHYFRVGFSHILPNSGCTLKAALELLCNKPTIPHHFCTEKSRITFACRITFEGTTGTSHDYYSCRSRYPMRYPQQTYANISNFPQIITLPLYPIDNGSTYIP